MMQPDRPQSLLEAMVQELDKFSLPAPGELGPLYQCLEIICRYLRQLQAEASDHEFADQAAEIAFFKEILPAIEGRLFFYSQAISVEQTLPAHSSAEKVGHYEAAWKRVGDTYRDMGDFHLYHRLGGSHLDPLYFMRWKDKSKPIPADGALLLSDPRLRAPRSLDQARLVGFKLLEIHLEYRIWFLQQQFGLRSVHAPLRWQLSRAAITELIYALLEVKAFGTEAQDVKRISDYFQQVFHINIANIYATYEDNRLRKKDRTPFLNSLISALLMRMDHDDLHAL